MMGQEGWKAMLLIPLWEEGKWYQFVVDVGNLCLRLKPDAAVLEILRIVHAGCGPRDLHPSGRDKDEASCPMIDHYNIDSLRRTHSNHV
jgi:hypothetical protein